MDAVVKWIRIFLLTFIWLPMEVVKLLLARYVSKSMDRAITEDNGVIMKAIGWDEKDYAGTTYCLGYVKMWYRSRFLDIMKEAQRGKLAPNSDVIMLGDRKLCKILDFQTKGRPLILNFGSCT